VSPMLQCLHMGRSHRDRSWRSYSERKHSSNASERHDVLGCDLVLRMHAQLKHSAHYIVCATDTLVVGSSSESHNLSEHAFVRRGYAFFFVLPVTLQTVCAAAHSTSVPRPAPWMQRFRCHVCTSWERLQCGIARHTFGVSAWLCRR
jgi:hypothetical protein